MFLRSTRYPLRSVLNSYNSTLSVNVTKPCKKPLRIKSWRLFSAESSNATHFYRWRALEHIHGNIPDRATRASDQLHLRCITLLEQSTQCSLLRRKRVFVLHKTVKMPGILHLFFRPVLTYTYFFDPVSL